MRYLNMKRRGDVSVVSGIEAEQGSAMFRVNRESNPSTKGQTLLGQRTQRAHLSQLHYGPRCLCWIRLRFALTLTLQFQLGHRTFWATIAPSQWDWAISFACGCESDPWTRCAKLPRLKKHFFTFTFRSHPLLNSSNRKDKKNHEPVICRFSCIAKRHFVLVPFYLSTPNAAFWLLSVDLTIIKWWRWWLRRHSQSHRRDGRGVQLVVPFAGKCIQGWEVRASLGIAALHDLN